MYKIVTGARQGVVGMAQMVLPPPQTAEVRNLLELSRARISI
jgi:hypothetical protein